MDRQKKIQAAKSIRKWICLAAMLVAVLAASAAAADVIYSGSFGDVF